MPRWIGPPLFLRFKPSLYMRAFILIENLRIGYSGSLTELRCDARWWLVNSDGKTRVVILVHITFTQNQKSLLVKTWHMAPNPGRITRSSPPKVPTPNSSMTRGFQLPLMPSLEFRTATPPGRVLNGQVHGWYDHNS